MIAVGGRGGLSETDSDRRVSGSLRVQGAIGINLSLLCAHAAGAARPTNLALVSNY
jgi:hypothetical protein